MQDKEIKVLAECLHSYYMGTIKNSPFKNYTSKDDTEEKKLESEKSIKFIKKQYYKKFKSYKIENHELDNFIGMVIERKMDGNKFFPTIPELDTVYASFLKRKTQISAYSDNRFQVKIKCEVCDGTGVVFHRELLDRGPNLEAIDLGDKCLYCDFCKASDKFVKDLRHVSEGGEINERPSPYYMEKASKYYDGKQVDRINPFQEEKEEKLDIKAIIKKLKTVGDEATMKIHPKFQSDYYKAKIGVGDAE